MRNAGHVVPRETLLARVWGDEYRDQTDYLKVYVSRLRAKLEDDPERPRYILTERGLGYRFTRGAHVAQSRPDRLHQRPQAERLADDGRHAGGAFASRSLPQPSTSTTGVVGDRRRTAAATWSPVRSGIP